MKVKSQKYIYFLNRRDELEQPIFNNFAPPPSLFKDNELEHGFGDENPNFNLT